MIGFEELSAATDSIGQEAHVGVPELLASLEISEPDFLKWSALGKDALMGEVTMALVAQDIARIEGTLQSALMSMFLVGFKVGQEN